MLSISEKNAGTKSGMGCWMAALHENLPCDHGNNVNEASGLSFIRDMKILCVQTYWEKLTLVKSETQLNVRENQLQK